MYAPTPVSEEIDDYDIVWTQVVEVRSAKFRTFGETVSLYNPYYVLLLYVLCCHVKTNQSRSQGPYIVEWDWGPHIKLRMGKRELPAAHYFPFSHNSLPPNIPLLWDDRRKEAEEKEISVCTLLYYSTELLSFIRLSLRYFFAKNVVTAIIIKRNRE